MGLKEVYRYNDSAKQEISRHNYSAKQKIVKAIKKIAAVATVATIIMTSNNCSNNTENSNALKVQQVVAKTDIPYTEEWEKIDTPYTQEWEKIKKDLFMKIDGLYWGEGAEGAKNHIKRMIADYIDYYYIYYSKDKKADKPTDRKVYISNGIVYCIVEKKMEEEHPKGKEFIENGKEVIEVIKHILNKNYSNEKKVDYSLFALEMGQRLISIKPKCLGKVELLMKHIEMKSPFYKLNNIHQMAVYWCDMAERHMKNYLTQNKNYEALEIITLLENKILGEVSSKLESLEKQIENSK